MSFGAALRRSVLKPVSRVVPAKMSASMLLTAPVRQSGNGSTEIQVLLMRRPAHASFAPNAVVFPGGVLDESDKGDCRWTAIRELFEETGILLKSSGKPEDCEALGTVADDCTRDRVLNGQSSFESVLDYQDAPPTTLWCTIETPFFERRRFITKFYHAHVPAQLDARPDSRGEVASLMWIRPEEAVEAANKKQLMMMPPQFMILSALAHCRTVDGVLKEAQLGDACAPDVRPRLVRSDETQTTMALLDRTDNEREWECTVHRERGMSVTRPSSGTQRL